MRTRVTPCRRAPQSPSRSPAYSAKCGVVLWQVDDPVPSDGPAGGRTDEEHGTSGAWTRVAPTSAVKEESALLMRPLVLLRPQVLTVSDAVPPVVDKELRRSRVSPMEKLIAISTDWGVVRGENAHDGREALVVLSNDATEDRLRMKFEALMDARVPRAPQMLEDEAHQDLPEHLEERPRWGAVCRVLSKSLRHAVKTFGENGVSLMSGSCRGPRAVGPNLEHSSPYADGHVASP